MKISIIVPAYNESKNLAVSLHSLLNQTYPHIELIVVDNNSSDETGAIAKQFTDKVYLEVNSGYVHAVACGAKEASGELITFCDADTRYPADWLERIMATFYKHPQSVAVYGTSITYDATRFLNCFNSVVYTGLIIASRYVWRFHNTAGFNFVIKKSAYDQVGGYDTQYKWMSPDIELGKRLKKIGPLILAPGICVGTSFRRFEKGGKWKTFWFFIWSWWEMVKGSRPSETYESYSLKARS